MSFTVRDIVLGESRGALELIQLSQEVGIVSTVGPLCSRCQTPMTLQVASQFVDQYAWRCQKQTTVNKRKCRCNSSRSIRSAWLASGSHLKLSDFLIFVRLWITGAPYNVISAECSINSNHTTTRISRSLLNVLKIRYIDHGEMLGGEGKTVEIDESKMGKRKFHRGHPVEGCWVFGGYERESGKCFAVPVARRNAAYLLPIIHHFIAPGTTIYSDCWKAYHCLANKGFQHMSVNHTIHFVDTETNVHTNAIESSWCAFKKVILPCHRTKSLITAHLARYLFNKDCRLTQSDRFVAFCKLVKEVENPSSTAKACADAYKKLIERLENLELPPELERSTDEQDSISANYVTDPNDSQFVNYEDLDDVLDDEARDDSNNSDFSC